jgi:hypothetical protein
VNHPLAQMAALVCHGNAFLQGHSIPNLLETNSTFQFCDWVKFVKLRRSLLGKRETEEIARTPNAWLELLKSQSATALRLTQKARNDTFPDRLTAGLTGGGPVWSIEVTYHDGSCVRWFSGWQVWNQKAPNRRIWRVSYACAATQSTAPQLDLRSASARLKEALTRLERFAREQTLNTFAACFSRALETLASDGSIRHGYHRDLAPELSLSPQALCLLDACQSAWVFGGMGSWNDLGFQGETQAEYERISQELFEAVNNAVQCAANTTAHPRAAT